MVIGSICKPFTLFFPDTYYLAQHNHNIHMTTKDIRRAVSSFSILINRVHFTGQHFLHSATLKKLSIRHQSTSTCSMKGENTTTTHEIIILLFSQKPSLKFTLSFSVYINPKSMSHLQQILHGIRVHYAWIQQNTHFQLARLISL